MITLQLSPCTMQHNHDKTLEEIQQFHRGVKPQIAELNRKKIIIINTKLIPELVYENILSKKGETEYQSRPTLFLVLYQAIQ